MSCTALYLTLGVPSKCRLYIHPEVERVLYDLWSHGGGSPYPSSMQVNPPKYWRAQVFTQHAKEIGIFTTYFTCRISNKDVVMVLLDYSTTTRVRHGLFWTHFMSFRRFYARVGPVLVPFKFYCVVLLRTPHLFSFERVLVTGVPFYTTIYYYTAYKSLEFVHFYRVWCWCCCLPVFLILIYVTLARNDNLILA